MTSLEMQFTIFIKSNWAFFQWHKFSQVWFFKQSVLNISKKYKIHSNRCLPASNCSWPCSFGDPHATWSPRAETAEPAGLPLQPTASHQVQGMSASENPSSPSLLFTYLVMTSSSPVKTSIDKFVFPLNRNIFSVYDLSQKIESDRRKERCHPSILPPRNNYY